MTPERTGGCGYLPPLWGESPGRAAKTQTARNPTKLVQTAQCPSAGEQRVRDGRARSLLLEDIRAALMPQSEVPGSCTPAAWHLS